MRCGTLPDGAQDKVTCKSLLTRRRDGISPTRSGDVLQQRFWVFLLGVTGEVIETY